MCRLDVPDLLAEYDATGLTVEQIAKSVDIHQSKIDAAVQLLASTGWFIEESGGRYKNTRFSEQLRTGRHGSNWARAS
jgi:predicted transcriptional regulator